LSTLSDVPRGLSLVFDTNIFVYWALDHPRFGDSCEKIIRRVEDGDILGFIPFVVANELLHRMMIAETISRGFASNGPLAVNLLKHDSTITRKLSIPWKIYRELTRMNFTIIEGYLGTNRRYVCAIQKIFSSGKRCGNCLMRTETFHT